MAESVFCEPVLAFAKAFRLRGDVNALKQAALCRFSIPMLSDAKKALWEACADDLSSLELPYMPRRSSEKRSQATADLDDILLALSKLDDIDKIPQIYCEATDLVKLPPIAADPISELVIGNSVCLKDIEGKISQLQDDIASLCALSSKVKTSILSTPPSHTSFAGAVRADNYAVPGTTGPRMTKTNRVDNLIIFGLPEVNSLPDLKKSIDELLNFLTGRSVPLSDLFRLGQRKKSPESSSPIRPRPVLLKLMSSWDRRLIMSTVRKLKGFRLKGIFIREDLSPEDRQKRRERFLARSSSAVVSDSIPLDPSAHRSSPAAPSVNSHPGSDVAT